jgi:hypothetical protein
MVIRIALTFVIGSLVISVAREGLADQPGAPPSAPNEAPTPSAFFSSELPTYPDIETKTSSSSYVGPFQLRSVIPKTGVRLDTTLAPYTFKGVTAQEIVLLVSGSLRVSRTLALQVRWGADDNRVSSGDASRTGILNPTVGVLWGIPIGRDFRFAASTWVGIPLATGGGNGADPNDIALQKEGILARSAMDNTSFAMNDVGFPTGISFAYIAGGFTGQIDSTVIPSFRVKGEQLQPDRSKVNSTHGLFLGYFVIPELSLGAELRYQRYLTTPDAVAKDPSTRDNLTAAAGFRLHIELSQGAWARPGLSYGRGLRGPVEQQSFQMVQLDIPVSF